MHKEINSKASKHRQIATKWFMSSMLIKKAEPVAQALCVVGPDGERLPQEGAFSVPGVPLAARMITKASQYALALDIHFWRAPGGEGWCFASHECLEIAQEGLKMEGYVF